MDCTSEKLWVEKPACLCVRVNAPIGASMCVGVCVFKQVLQQDLGFGLGVKFVCVCVCVGL